MDAKLTLKLDKEVIDRAKVYARERQESLSVLVERYFRYIVEQEEGQPVRDIAPTVRELSGIIDLDESIDAREIRTDYLLDKYR